MSASQLTDAPRDLETSRLRLVAMTPAMLRADLARDGSLRMLLAAELPPEWPPADWEPHVTAMTLQQALDLPWTLGWHRYVLLQERSTWVLAGCIGGFLKPEATVELGYSILPMFQHRGYATEAVSALIRWLAIDPQVRVIMAQAALAKTESIKVMQRCGLQFAGVGDDPDTVRYTLDCR